MSLTSFLVALSTYFLAVGVAIHLDESMPRPRPSSSVLGFKTNRNAEEAESIQDKQKGKDIKVKSKQCLTGHTFRPTGGVHRQLPCSRGHLAMPWHTHHTLARRDHPCIVVLPRADAGPRHGRGGNWQVRGWSPLACSISPGASIIH